MVHLNGFNANEVDPKVGFEPIPSGMYMAIIEDTQEKQTKAGDGSYLEFKFQIVDGQHKGRNLWARLNLNNRNSTAVKLAQAELSSICRAVGILQPNDSCDLHDIPLLIEVGMEKRSDNGELSNVIKGYQGSGHGKSIAPATPSAPQPSQAQTPQPPQTPPWQAGAAAAPPASPESDVSLGGFDVGDDTVPF